VTGRCYGGKRFFDSEEKKMVFQRVLKQVAKDEEVGIFAWVMLHNHYHILITLYPEWGEGFASDDDRLTPVTPFILVFWTCFRSMVFVMYIVRERVDFLIYIRVGIWSISLVRFALHCLSGA